MTIKPFYCSCCRKETDHRENEDGTWTCCVCEHIVTARNAEIAILYMVGAWKK